MDVFWTLPPVSRTITALAVAVSALGYGGLISLSQYIFASHFVFTTKMFPQLWRIFTAFLITKRKFAILLDPYFLYQYGSSIERESPRFSQPGDFFVYTAFVGSVIVPTLAEAVPKTEGEYPCTSCRPVIIKIQKGRVWCVSMVGLPLENYECSPFVRRCWLPTYLFNPDHTAATAGLVLDTYTFLPALSLAYAYTFAQDNPTRSVSFFIITFDSKYLPFAMLFMTFIIDGSEPALAQLCGLIAAHLYDFLTRIWPTFGGGKNYITTPAVVKRLFGAGPGSVQSRGYGYAVEGRGRAAGAPGSGAPSTEASTGVSNRWGGVGPGRRLGD
ncbi:DER1-domain-containing protein [Clathrospora elynae]|uniref:Derlin n=1 Tax=Clathrospora elynae TaxID=706981 RepID=A0A6A5T4J8_9PLEO|nr:DER1-domain-containing protein [Clathrospora elynae]